MITLPYAQFYLAFIFFMGGSKHFTTSFASMNTGSTSTSASSSSLKMGGYDATVGANPSLPIQFFTLPENACPYAARTRIALQELNLDYETTEISVSPKPDWYLRINPRGKVPAIRVPACNNEVITESAICNEFLCDYAFTTGAGTGSTTTLLPQDPTLRARIRLLNDHCDNVMTKAQYTYFMNKDVANDSEMLKQLENTLEVYEDAINQSGGPFLMGEQFTLADAHMLPFFLRLVVSLEHFKRYLLPQDKFPKLLEWFHLCSKRDSVKESSLSNDRIIDIYTKFLDIDYSFGGLNANKK